ncbi:MAG: hypothetical protein NUW37_08295 [Planctomycetes bacterium]|nr:hypothetical protein [Planctomycetota bacterium]
MPDALAHLCFSLSTRRLVRPLFAKPVGSLGLSAPVTSTTYFLWAFGNVVPDVITKFMADILKTPPYFPVPVQTPIGWIVVCYLLSFLFVERQRKTVFFVLLLGGFAHIFLDYFEYHLEGVGQMMPFAPFSYERTSFWVVQNDMSFMRFTPVMVLIAIAVEIGYRLFERLTGKAKEA